METNLFTYESYDQLDNAVFQFIDCTLKQPIGEYVAGDQIESIVVNYEAGTISLWFGTFEVIFEAELRIGNRIKITSWSDK